MTLKRKLVILAILLLSTFLSKEVLAARDTLPDGLLVGDDQGIKVSTDGGYFFNLDNLQPGDVVTRNLMIKNNRDEAYQLQLDIETKSQIGGINLVENMTMQIQIDDQEIYQGNLSNDKKGNKVMSFGTIPAHSEKKAVIQLVVNDKIANWDQAYYSGSSKAIIEWRFKATHPYPKKASTGDRLKMFVPAAIRRLLPKTGHTSAKWIMVVGVLLIAGASGIFPKRRLK